MARYEATVPVELQESRAPFDCNVVFSQDKHGTIRVLSVQKPVGVRSYVDIDLPEKTYDWIESWLYDNWAEY